MFKSIVNLIGGKLTPIDKENSLKGSLEKALDIKNLLEAGLNIW